MWFVYIGVLFISQLIQSTYAIQRNSIVSTTFSTTRNDASCNHSYKHNSIAPVGFHQLLHYDVCIDPQPLNHTLQINQFIPNTIICDYFELVELNQFYKSIITDSIGYSITYHMQQRIDLEAASTHINAASFHVTMNVQITNINNTSNNIPLHITLPIHYRYQPSSYNMNDTGVSTIPPPTICVAGTNHNHKQCDNTIHNDIILHIPIGNLNDISYTYTTAVLTTLCSTSFIIYTLMSGPDKIKFSAD